MISGVSSTQKKKGRKERKNEQIHKLPNHLICFFTHMCWTLFCAVAVPGVGMQREPRVISAHREFQVTGTQSVHIPSAQDANAIGDKRKKGEISGWVI